MAMHDSDFEEFAAKYPVLWHWTKPENVDSILNHGILPWDSDGPSQTQYEDLDNQPRPETVYLALEGYDPFGWQEYKVPLIVETKSLDPSRIIVDEDGISLDPHFDELWDANSESSRGQIADLGSEHFDHPDWIVDEILRGKTLAYKGSIPATAISLPANISEYDAWPKRVGKTPVKAPESRSKGFKLRRVAGTPEGLRDLSRFVGTGECTEISQAIEDAYPELKRDGGFYDDGSGMKDHSWNVGPDGTIYDATHGQFDPDVPVYIGPNDGRYKSFVNDWEEIESHGWDGEKFSSLWETGTPKNSATDGNSSEKLILNSAYDEGLWDEEIETSKPQSPIGTPCPSCGLNEFAWTRGRDGESRTMGACMNCNTAYDQTDFTVPTYNVMEEGSEREQTRLDQMKRAAIVQMMMWMPTDLSDEDIEKVANERIKERWPDSDLYLDTDWLRQMIWTENMIKGSAYDEDLWGASKPADPNQTSLEICPQCQSHNGITTPQGVHRCLDCLTVFPPFSHPYRIWPDNSIVSVLREQIKERDKTSAYDKDVWSVPKDRQTPGQTRWNADGKGLDDGELYFCPRCGYDEVIVEDDPDNFEGDRLNYCSKCEYQWPENASEPIMREGSIEALAILAQSSMGYDLNNGAIEEWLSDYVVGPRSDPATAMKTAATLTLYHGTNNDRFEEFVKKPGMASVGFLGLVEHNTNGFYFTDEPKEASNFGDNVAECRVTINNPLFWYDGWQADTETLDYIFEPLLEEGTRGGKPSGVMWYGGTPVGNPPREGWVEREISGFYGGPPNWRTVSDLNGPGGNEVAQRMKSLGFDGSLIGETDMTEAEYSYFVLDPSQIEVVRWMDKTPTFGEDYEPEITPVYWNDQGHLRDEYPLNATSNNVWKVSYSAEVKPTKDSAYDENLWGAPSEEGAKGVKMLCPQCGSGNGWGFGSGSYGCLDCHQMTSSRGTVSPASPGHEDVIRDNLKGEGRKEGNATPSESPGKETLQDDSRAYVAEGVMVENGLAGRTHDIPIGTMPANEVFPNQPADETIALGSYGPKARELSAWASEVAGFPVRIIAASSIWESETANAAADHVTHRITVTPYTNDLTLLHEIAHLIAGPDAGHGKEWRDTAARLYQEHISPEASELFLSLATPPEISKEATLFPENENIFDLRQPFLMNQEGAMVIGAMGTHHEDLDWEYVIEVFGLPPEPEGAWGPGDAYWKRISPLEGHILWLDDGPHIQWPDAVDEGARVFEENLLDYAKSIQADYDWASKQGKQGRKQSSETLPQQLRRWEKFQPHTETAEVAEEFPDGWTIKKINDCRSMVGIGAMLQNCWKYQQEETWDNAWGEVEGIYSMHDENDIPRAAFYVEDGTVTQLLGRNNKPVDGSIYNRAKQFAMDRGSDIWDPRAYGVFRVGASRLHSSMPRPSHLEKLFAVDLDSELEQLVTSEGPAVWNSMKYPSDCHEASLKWGQLIADRLGRSVQYVYGNYLGGLDEQTQIDVKEGRLSPPSSSDHAWLEVDGMIFDPTASQYQPVSGQWREEDYEAEGRKPIVEGKQSRTKVSTLTPDEPGLPDYLYHVSPYYNRDNIYRHGLSPNSQSPWEYSEDEWTEEKDRPHTPGVYFYDNIAAAKRYAYHLADNWVEPDYIMRFKDDPPLEPVYDIWSVPFVAVANSLNMDPEYVNMGGKSLTYEQAMENPGFETDGHRYYSDRPVDPSLMKLVLRDYDPHEDGPAADQTDFVPSKLQYVPDLMEVPEVAYPKDTDMSLTDVRIGAYKEELWSKPVKRDDQQDGQDGQVIITDNQWEDWHAGDNDRAPKYHHCPECGSTEIKHDFDENMGECIEGHQWGLDEAPDSLIHPKTAAPAPDNWQEQVTPRYYNKDLEGRIPQYGYHGTSKAKAERILEEGLKPWDSPDVDQVHGSRFEHDYYEPRPGHAYLALDPAIAIGATDHIDDNWEGGATLLRIDLSKLDPQRINPDEDGHPQAGDYENWEAAWRDGEPEWPTLGMWAEDTGFGDDPDETVKQLNSYSSIAYRGTIPPEAISEIGGYDQGRWPDLTSEMEQRTAAATDSQLIKQMEDLPEDRSEVVHECSLAGHLREL